MNKNNKKTMNERNHNPHDLYNTNTNTNSNNQHDNHNAEIAAEFDSKVKNVDKKDQ